MKAYRWFTLVGAGLITAFVALIFVAASGTVQAATPAAGCDMQLVVALTPDVTNPEDVGFLSSLLSNQVGYRLTLLRQDDPTVIVVDLTGPGPDYRCQDVLETMRRDGRVLTIQRENPDDIEAVSVVGTPAPPEEPQEEPQEETAGLSLSHAGIGSLYWAARNPEQAWQLLFPVQPGDATNAYADYKARCEFIIDPPGGQAPCP